MVFISGPRALALACWKDSELQRLVIFSRALIVKLQLTSEKLLLERLLGEMQCPKNKESKIRFPTFR